jgi:hypothetical protein
MNPDAEYVNFLYIFGLNVNLLFPDSYLIFPYVVFDYVF